MPSRILEGATDKFAESFGSGLAYGIVAVLAIVVLKFWFLRDDPIVQMTSAATVCNRDNFGNNCVVNADCKEDEIVIGGECNVDEGFKQEVHLQNFGMSKARETDIAPGRFFCNWSGEAANAKDPQKLMIPRVMAVCINKSRFGYQLPLGKS